MMLTVLAVCVVASPPCVEVQLPPTRSITQKGPGCLVAATAMALQAAGDSEADYRSVSLQTRVYTTGTSFFDVALTVQKRGFKAIVTQGGEGELAAALALGIAPVAAVKGRGKARHAVYVEGIKLGCGRSHVLIRDPRNPTLRQVDLEAFHRMQSKRQLLLVIKEQAAWKRFGKARTRAKHQAFSTRFMAEGFKRRAVREKKGSLGYCRFLSEAAALDPTLPGLDGLQRPCQ